MNLTRIDGDMASNPVHVTKYEHLAFLSSLVDFKI